jgi:small subunit ribosomal protein S1
VLVQLSDGVGLFVEQVGDSDGLPLIALHGGPGLDHSMFRPYLDPLADDFRLLYVDGRGQGRSERVDPPTLSVDVFARDVDLLAQALGLDRFALLGHSFGAIVATHHAIELGTARAYVISGGADSTAALEADVSQALAALGEEDADVVRSWEMEKTVQTDAEAAELMRMQLPFHFAGNPPPGYMEDAVYSADVLRHFANAGYGNFDYTPDLGRIARPTLVVVGSEDRTTTPRANRVLHEGIPGSELVVLDGAGHMSFVERTDDYLDAVQPFLRRASDASGGSNPHGYTDPPLTMTNETVDTEPRQLTDDTVWTTGEDGERIPNYEATFPEIVEGHVVTGQVVRVDKDEVLVDVGYKSEGVIPVSELSIRRSVDPDQEVKVGDAIDALVMTKEDAEGRLILSKKRARFEIAWKAIERAAETGEPVLGRVIEVVKGGLIVDLGVRGFLPASLVDIRRVQDLDEFMGQELRCKVIEINRARNNVVLSRRAVLEDERKEMRQAILDRLQPGDVVEGTISNIVDFGAFVDLDGMDGLIHISELSWSHVNHPSEVLDIGQEVKVKVLDIDRERQRISLGLKQTQSDPWQHVLDSNSEGDIVDGKVTKVVTFGAFVEILPGVEGLVHISELASHHVENPREVVSQGDEVKVMILEIDGDRRRLSLSLRRVPEDVQTHTPPPPATDEVPLTPNLGLSEEVFGDEPAAEAESAEPSDGAETAEPEAETAPDESLPEELAEETVEADEASPDEPGPGDSEGSPPEAPPEATE